MAWSSTSVGPVPDFPLDRIRVSAELAFDRSSFYRRIYVARPIVASSEDFLRLPIVDTANLATTDGVTDLAYLDDEQLVMEINPAEPVIDQLTFTPIENEFDVERRYRRIARILKHCEVERSGLAILADSNTFYVAAEIERVLPWPVSILLTSPKHRVAHDALLKKLGTSACILTTPGSPVVALHGKNVTFNRCPLANPSNHFDVISLSLIPWFAVSLGNRTYCTLDNSSSNSDEPQFFLERGDGDTLIVTVLTPAPEAGSIPIVRYNTGLKITHLGWDSFGVEVKTSR